MDKFQKDNNLMTGKGETEEVSWITVNGAHIPIEEGESKQEAIAKRFKDKTEQQSHLDKLIKQLQEWQRKIPDDVIRREIRLPKEKLKELSNKIRNFEPITLEINGRQITAQFDKYTANKNIRTKGNSSVDGYNYKLDHVDEIPDIVKSSRFHHSTPELGKDAPQHKGVKMWHYFKTEAKTSQGVFDVTVNIRDKGNEQFVYEIALA